MIIVTLWEVFMGNYDDFEEDYTEDLDLEELELEEEDDGFLSFKNFLLNEADVLDDKNRKLLKKSNSHLYVLWDIYKDDYIDYCEENGYEHETLDED
jgi:hypothetical protein